MPKIGEKSFDLRLVERFVHLGQLKKADYDKYLKSLPDEADNALESRPGDPDYEAELANLAAQKKEAAKAPSEE